MALVAWITAVVRVWTQVLKRQCPGIFTLPYSIFTLPRHCMQYVSEILECSIAGLVYLVFFSTFQNFGPCTHAVPSVTHEHYGGLFFLPVHPRRGWRHIWTLGGSRAVWYSPVSSWAWDPVCVCVCVCVFVFVFVYMYISEYKCIHTHTHTLKHTPQ